MSPTPPKSNDADSAASRATLRVKTRPAAAKPAASAERKSGPRGAGDRHEGPGRRDERRPSGPRRDDRSGNFRGEREGFAPRGERGPRFDRADRPERSERPSRPYAPRDGQGDRGEARGFGRPDRPYQPRREGFGGERNERPRFDRAERGDRSERPSRPYTPRDGEGRGDFRREERGNFRSEPRGESRGFGRDERPSFRGNREGFAPRGERTERPRFDRAERGDRSERPSRPYTPRDGQERGEFRREERGSFRSEPRGESRGFGRSEREGFAPRGERTERPRFDRAERVERSDRPSRPYTPRDGQERGDFRREERGDKPEFRSREEYRAERRAGPKPGESRGYGGIRTYRAPEGLGGKSAPIKVIRPPEPIAREDARPGDMRINKRMAELGMCSRREADEWVENGWVKVNGEVAAMGQMVVPGDRIEIDAAAQERQEQQVTIVLHKPAGFVCGQPEEGQTGAVALIKPETRWHEDHSATRFNFSQLKGLAPCGLLDEEASGLLVLSQDGRVARALVAEDAALDKEYLVRVAYGVREVDVQGAFPAERITAMREGLEVEGEQLPAVQVTWHTPEQLRFVLPAGQKLHIRLLCEVVGLTVLGVQRTRVGQLSLGALPQGQWRYLGADEQFSKM